MKTRTLLILGKLPPPFLGPALATEILIRSKLKNRFNIVHINTNVHETLLTIGVINIKKIFKNLNIYIELIKSILKHKPDIALIPISQSTLGFLKDAPFIIICRLLSVRTVVQVRGSNIKNWLMKSSFLTKIFFRMVIKSCQGAIVLGECLRFIFQNYFDNSKIFVVPNGADYPLPGNEFKKFNNKILYLANLQSSKGIEDFINALVILKQEHKTEFSADVVGMWRDEKTKSTCVKIVNDFLLPVNFFPPAIKEEKYKFYSNADIFVFPPREPEGHPWVIVEAMAFGLPIISTNQGAIRESVIDGENGFIVESNNPGQIADKINYLLLNPEISKTMGKKGKEFYFEKFTEDKMVENLSLALETTIENS
jgi:glycosyltransferase involved in cell wall biosynthesis